MVSAHGGTLMPGGGMCAKKSGSPMSGACFEAVWAGRGGYLVQRESGREGRNSFEEEATAFMRQRG